MRKFSLQLPRALWPVLVALLSLPAPGVSAGLSGAAQEVIDRIVAHVEGDILLQSEVRELGAYQELAQGQAASEDKLLSLLIDQWIVANEADAAHFSRPSDEEISRDAEQLRKQFASLEAYRERLRQVGLSEAGAQRVIERQIYVSSYLDYKFRPAGQVDAPAVRKYYNEELVPQLAARGQTAPPLRDVYEQIRELLVQRDISARATQWLDETRSRLKIEILPPRGRS